MSQGSNNESYLSSDDSKFFRDEIRKYRGTNFLEIGTGRGSNLLEVSRNFQQVVGTDIHLNRLAYEDQQNIEFVRTDSASCFREMSFEVVAFNPPYLPSEKIVDPTVNGGKGGVEVAKHFLEDAVTVLKEHGKILILLSSASSIEAFREYCLEEHLIFRRIANRRLFYETLTIYEVKKEE